MTLFPGKEGALPLHHTLHRAGSDPAARAEVERKSMTGRASPQAKSLIDQNLGRR